MLKLIFCLVLSLFAVAISNELYVFGPYVNPVECIRPGTVCKNCTERAVCVEISDGIYESYPSSSCPAGTTCVTSTGACTTSPNPPCGIDPPSDNYEFVCHQVGMFPDPFDCQTYHLCSPPNPPDISGAGVLIPKSLEYTCTGDFYYDSRTTLCRKKLINGTCPEVTAPCKALGDIGVIAGNPSLYYVCLYGTDPIEGEFFPNIFACLNNFQYNVTIRRCVDPTPISGTDANGRCTAVGEFTEPSGCSFYKYCSAINATAILRSCPTRTYFNSMTSACVEFTCADVDK